MRKLLILLSCLLISLILPGCGNSTSGGSSTSGIPYRAFLSDDVTAGTSSAGIYIVNAEDDVRGPTTPISAGNTPGMMVLTPNRAQTLVFSGNNTPTADNQFSIINNAGENNAAHIALAGYTESILASPDSSTAYAAIPNATVVGQSPGKISLIAIPAGTVLGEIDIPSVHYLSINNSGNQIMAFTDVLATLGPSCQNQSPSYLFVVVPSDIGLVPCPVIPVPGFDHPVQAYFTSDDTTAYVINCGPECGGVQASVEVLDMTSCSVTTSPPSCAAPVRTVSVPAATESLVIGSTMYLAGTPYSGGVPSQPCTGQQTAATTCGLLTIFDLSTMTYPAPIVITDGYHNRMAMGPNGQLFIGASTCTEIIPPLPPPPGAEVRGCLSIYNSLNTAVGTNPAGGVVIPPQNGDATGIQPIANRNVVYVVQGGSLKIYDDTVDALEYNPHNPNNPGEILNLVGQFVDVKTVDF